MVSLASAPPCPWPGGSVPNAPIGESEKVLLPGRRAPIRRSRGPCALARCGRCRWRCGGRCRWCCGGRWRAVGDLSSTQQGGGSPIIPSHAFESYRLHHLFCDCSFVELYLNLSRLTHYIFLEFISFLLHQKERRREIEFSVYCSESSLWFADRPKHLYTTFKVYSFLNILHFCEFLFIHSEQNGL